MSHRGIDGDDEIELLDQRRGIMKIRESVGEIVDRPRFVHCAQSLARFADLQADVGRAGKAKERFQISERQRTGSPSRSLTVRPAERSGSIKE